MIITLLSGFNILLLYTNVNLQNQIKTLNLQIPSWASGKISALNIKITHHGVKLPDDGLSMVAFFSDQGCKSCIEHEVQNLNKIFRRYKKHIRVYLLSNNKSYLKRLFGATFPYAVMLPEEEPLFNTEFDVTNPVIVLTDSDKTLQHVYIAEKDKPQKSNQFYKSMRALFESLQ